MPELLVDFLDQCVAAYSDICMGDPVKIDRHCYEEQRQFLDEDGETVEPWWICQLFLPTPEHPESLIEIPIMDIVQLFDEIPEVFASADHGTGASLCFQGWVGDRAVELIIDLQINRKWRHLKTVP